MIENTLVIKEIGLKDWFAGMALQGMMSLPNVQSINPHDIAEDCYMVAELMMNKRKEDK